MNIKLTLIRTISVLGFRQALLRISNLYNISTPLIIKIKLPTLRHPTEDHLFLRLSIFQICAKTLGTYVKGIKNKVSYLHRFSVMCEYVVCLS